MKSYLLKRYEEAEKLGAWDVLLGYWQLLFYWQAAYARDMSIISRLASHWHGYTHHLCDKPSLTHPVPHSRCRDDCEKFEKFIESNLRTRLVIVCKTRQEKMGQLLLDLKGGKND